MQFCYGRSTFWKLGSGTGERMTIILAFLAFICAVFTVVFFILLFVLLYDIRSELRELHRTLRERLPPAAPEAQLFATSAKPTDLNQRLIEKRAKELEK
jgi:uncharacterized membrane protein